MILLILFSELRPKIINQKPFNYYTNRKKSEEKKVKIKINKKIIHENEESTRWPLRLVRILSGFLRLFPSGSSTLTLQPKQHKKPQKSAKKSNQKPDRTNQI
jgi:hypothetical protein